MKTIIREVIALIILLIAIMLMVVMFFFDYIKSDSNQPQAATYQMTENELEILKEKDDYSNSNSQNTVILSNDHTLTEEELVKYKASGELKTGQSNPFDETAVTGVLYDAEGNAYYKTITSKNEAQKSSTWYGTVSGNNLAPTQTVVPTGAVKTPTPTVTPIPTPTATPAPTPTPNQVYNPDKDITAPSSDSGNLSQSTGRK